MPVVSVPDNDDLLTPLDIACPDGLSSSDAVVGVGGAAAVVGRFGQTSITSLYEASASSSSHRIIPNGVGYSYSGTANTGSSALDVLAEDTSVVTMDTAIQPLEALTVAAAAAAAAAGAAGGGGGLVVSSPGQGNNDLPSNQSFSGLGLSTELYTEDIGNQAEDLASVGTSFSKKQPSPPSSSSPQQQHQQQHLYNLVDIQSTKSRPIQNNYNNNNTNSRPADRRHMTSPVFSPLDYNKSTTTTAAAATTTTMQPNPNELLRTVTPPMAQTNAPNNTNNNTNNNNTTNNNPGRRQSRSHLPSMMLISSLRDEVNENHPSVKAIKLQQINKDLIEDLKKSRIIIERYDMALRQSIQEAEQTRIQIQKLEDEKNMLLERIEDLERRAVVDRMDATRGGGGGGGGIISTSMNNITTSGVGVGLGVSSSSIRPMVDGTSSIFSSLSSLRVTESPRPTKIDNRYRQQQQQQQSGKLFTGPAFLEQQQQQQAPPITTTTTTTTTTTAYHHHRRRSITSDASTSLASSNFIAARRSSYTAFVLDGHESLDSINYDESLSSIPPMTLQQQQHLPTNKNNTNDHGVVVSVGGGGQGDHSNGSSSTTVVRSTIPATNTNMNQGIFETLGAEMMMNNSSSGDDTNNNNVNKNNNVNNNNSNNNSSNSNNSGGFWGTLFEKSSTTTTKVHPLPKKSLNNNNNNYKDTLKQMNQNNTEKSTTKSSSSIKRAVFAISVANGLSASLQSEQVSN